MKKGNERKQKRIDGRKDKKKETLKQFLDLIKEGMKKDKKGKKKENEGWMKEQNKMKH